MEFRKLCEETLADLNYMYIELITSETQGHGGVRLNE